MNKRKLTNDELRDLLLENCVNENGDLVICDIDLSKFKGNVILKGWKIGGSAGLSSWEVKGNLYQHCQKVNGNLYQDCQTAENIFQDFQIVNGNLYQHCQKVKGTLYQGWQTAKNLEQDSQNVGAKKLKEISLDELAKMGYKLKEN